MEGNLEAADAAVREIQNLVTENRPDSVVLDNWPGRPGQWAVANRQAQLAAARASVLQARGRYWEAEAYHRDALATLAADSTFSWLIDRGGLVDADSGQVVFSYAHPIFWAPFTLIGDGGG
jgi:CHAT domain-containing protein